MKSFIDKIKSLLAKKQIVWMLFAFAVIIYSYQTLTTSRVGSDQMIQLATAANFIDGNGFVVQSAENLSDISSEKVLSWPYFYRLVALPVLFITGSNVELSYLILEIIAFGLLLFAIWYFIKNCNLENRNVILSFVFLFVAIPIAPVKYMADSDMFALGFALLALSFLIEALKDKKRIKYIILFFISIAMLPQIRYAYVPVSIAFILLFFLVLYFNKSEFTKKWTFIFIIIPIISLIFVLTNPYFLGTAEKYTVTSTAQISQIEQPIAWIKPFYAPFFNSFFPDYILASFGQKAPELWAIIVLPVIAIFIISSLIILVFLLLNYFRRSKNISYLFSKEKLPETGLFVLVFSTMTLFLIIYRNFAYSKSQLLSATILYEKLAVVNRYFGPIHVAVYLLAIINIVKYNSKFFKLIIFVSVLFGLFHFAYLRTVYHPFNRTNNMDIVNNPPGSYNDAVEIGDIIKREKKTKSVFYTSLITNDKEDVNYRQINPNLFALANGAIMLNYNANLDELQPEKQTIFYSGFNKNDL
jgi:hypothetical protein